MTPNSERTVQNEGYAPLVHAANAGLSVLGALGAPLTRLDPESILRAARRSTGLSDWGDEAFLTPMRQLLGSVNQAPLTSLGRTITRQTFIHAVKNRLYLQDYLKRHPEVYEIEVKRPIFVLGFPRTGTTVLQYLLSLDRDRRGLEFWELSTPVPVSEDAAEDKRLRLRAANQILRGAYWLAPEMGQVHYIGAETLEECWPLFFNSLAAMNMDLQSGQREIGDYLGQRDMVGPYQEYKLWLKLLLHRQGADHLVLKCPEHLWFLDAILEVFPDACIVQTHRDPVDTIASYCSLISMQWRNLYGSIDPKALGAHVQYRFLDGITRAMKTRQTADPKRFYDVDFSQFIHRQAEITREIAAYFELAWRPDADHQVQAWLDDKRADARGNHRYSIEHYGLDADEVYGQFADYIAATNLPLRYREPVAKAG